MVIEGGLEIVIKDHKMESIIEPKQDLQQKYKTCIFSHNAIIRF